MHAYMHTYIHVHTCTYMYIHVHTCTYMYMHVHACTCVHACIHTYIHIFIDSYIHTFIHTYIFTHMYIYRYTYTYIHWHTYTYTFVHTYRAAQGIRLMHRQPWQSIPEIRRDTSRVMYSLLGCLVARFAKDGGWHTLKTQSVIPIGHGIWFWGLSQRRMGFSASSCS